MPEPGQFITSAEQLLEQAGAALAADDYYAAPEVIHMTFTGEKIVPVVAENVCTYDCASDGRQVIYIAVPEDATCEELLGVEQRFLARVSSGRIEERTFCVPNTLVSN
jgi:hypothetical protein